MTISDVDPNVIDAEVTEETLTEFDAEPAATTASNERSVNEATFSVTQAAEACLVSRKTIVRRLPQLEEFGAWKDSQGQWVIPLSALLAADLRPGRPSRPEAEPPKSVASESKPATQGQATSVSRDDSAATLLRSELENWQRRATDAEKRAAVAEAIATERAGRVEDLRMALRQLEPVRPVPVHPIDEPKKGWRRFF